MNELARNTTVAATVFLAASPAAMAQLSPYEVPIGTTLKNPTDACLADLNGDGHLDLVACSRSTNFVGSIVSFDGLPGGAFGPARVLQQPGRQHEHIEVADVDGDGDLDVVTAGDSAALAWCENLGAGAFAERADLSVSGAPVFSFRFELVDIEGDGDVDAIVPGTFDVFVLRNDGSGSFTSSSVISTGIDRVIDARAVEVDADGLTDIALIVSNDFDSLIGSGVGVSLQHSTGTFQPFTRTATGISGFSSIATSDVDLDGDQDVLIVETTPGTVTHLENLGSGALQWDLTPLFTLPSASSVIPVDRDGDGDEDLLVVANGPPNNWQVRWATATGPSTYLPGPVVDIGLNYAGALAAALGTGAPLDVVTWSTSFDRIATHAPNGASAYGPPAPLTERVLVSESIWVDVDSDGLLDLVAIDDRTPVTRLLYAVQVPGGGFGPVSELQLSGTFFSDLRAADLDSDGEPEIVFAQSANGQPDEILITEAQGGSLTPVSVLVSYPGSAGFGVPEPVDLDGDGDLDLVVPSFSGTAFAIDNLGGLVFDAPRPLFTGPSPDQVAPVDLDGDGTRDLVLYSSLQASNTEVVAYRGLGDGSFAPGVAIGHETTRTPDLLTMDVDGDGDQDIVRRVARTTGSGTDILWYENLGAFSFGTAQLLAAGQSVNFRSGLRAVDWNLDGRADLVRMNHAGQGAQVLENLGGAVFAPPANLVTDVDDATDFELLDLDGDLDVDLSVSDNGALEYRLYRNAAELGSAFCAGLPNSTGDSGALRATGSDVPSVDAVQLTATRLPGLQLGLFVVSRDASAPVAIPNSQGLLCLGGSIGRYVQPGQFGLASASGTLSRRLTVMNSPIPVGGAQALTGETWRFQCWHRDLAPTATSNLTEAIEITWR